MSNDLAAILDELDGLAGDEADVSVGDVLDRTGHRSQGIFLLLPGLIGVSPLGAIPTLPSLMGLIVLILAVQIVFGRDSMWMPAPLRDRAVSNDRLKKAVGKMRGTAEWIDRHFGSRLTWLSNTVSIRLAAATCILLALTAPALEIVPFAAAIPMGAIALLGIAITLKDGVLMAVAFCASALALWGAWTLSPWT